MDPLKTHFLLNMGIHFVGQPPIFPFACIENGDIPLLCLLEGSLSLGFGISRLHRLRCKISSKLRPLCDIYGRRDLLFLAGYLGPLEYNIDTHDIPEYVCVYLLYRVSILYTTIMFSRFPIFRTMMCSFPVFLRLQFCT